MYTEKLKVAFDSTSETVLTSNAVIKKFAFFRPAIIRRVGIAISTACNSAGAIIVKVKKYPTFGSNSGAVDLATITIPAAQAAGGVVYKVLSPSAKLVEGDELVFEVTTAATVAGKGTCMFDADDSPEVVLNNSDLVASA